MGQSWRRWCRRNASGISKRRSAGSQDGTRPIPIRMNGAISPAPLGWPKHCVNWSRWPDMGIYAIRMPDIGEGIAEAEIAEWLVKPGDVLREDDPMVAVMTDKATVEIPSPVTGTV